MKKPPSKPESSKSKSLRKLEYLLFFLCLGIIALRATFTEAPAGRSTNLEGLVNDTVYSLSLSGVLITAFLIWLGWSFCSRRFVYRFTGIELGVLLLVAAAVVGFFAAANKRVAITTSVTLLAPVVMAVLLVQLLDSDVKIKLVLICVAALGVVSAWQSAEQYMISNQVMLQHYEEDPAQILEPLGIQPGSLNHMLLEHRIYSKDVKGFFTTGNSAGSFAILALSAAAALLFERIGARKSAALCGSAIALAAVGFAAVLFALLITRSKGAIAASVIAALVFGVLLRFARPLTAHRLIVGVLALVLLAGLCWAAVDYGFEHGRLPGGNSMLVRWQYWQASWNIIRDYPLTGIGPGNFTYFYTQYKPPAAPETVADPHCLVLSLLSQYGPLGLAGFLLFALFPLYKALGRWPSKVMAGEGSRFVAVAVASALAAMAAMALLRPLVTPPTTADTPDARAYVWFVTYAAPVLTFAVGFWLFAAVARTNTKGRYSLTNTRFTAAACAAALIAVLVHNLIDFAIFEPGVLTSFCAILACLLAVCWRQGPPRLVTFPARRLWIRLVVSVALVAAPAWLYLRYVWQPVYLSTDKTTQAREAAGYGQFELAHNLLTAATSDDVLSPEPPYFSGRLHLIDYSFSAPDNPELLSDAEQCFFLAADRNFADYRSFAQLAEVYTNLAEAIPDQRDDSLTKAFDSAVMAVELYPGNGRLHLKLAQIADALGDTPSALEHYTAAVEIEDAFREQFSRMYPGRPAFSRLGQQNYDLARQRIETLSQQ